MWIKYIKEIFHSVGRSVIITINDFSNVNVSAMENSVIRTLKDQYMQKWNTQLDRSSKGQNHKLFKPEIAFESYLIKYPKKIY